MPNDAADPRRSPPLTPSPTAGRAEPDPADPRRSPPLTPSPTAGRAEPDPADPRRSPPLTPSPTAGRPLLAAAIVLGVVVLDQLSKWWAVRELPGDPVRLFDDVGFVLVRNTGGAFSLFQAFTPFLAIIAIVVAVVLVRTVGRTRDLLMVVGLSLVLGGALGNLIDRLFRTPGFLEGAVVDFVHVGSFPTFNVADSAITVGATLIVIWAVLADARERRAARTDNDAGAGG